MTFRFTQDEAPLPMLGEDCHLLQAVEGAPTFARLCACRDALVSEDGGTHTLSEAEGPGGDYRLDLVTDTGPAGGPYGIVMLVAFNVPVERTAEVDRWYDEEHIPLLMQADGWLRARRFRVLDHRGRRWTSLAFHELRDMGVLDSEGRRIARSTPWRAELEREAWFRSAGRWVFRPHRG